MDTPIASDLSYLVLQRRRERGECGPCALDRRNRGVYALPPQVAQFDGFIASRPTGVSEAEWEIKRQQRQLIG
jgi:hypothetical protein